MKPHGVPDKSSASGHRVAGHGDDCICKYKRVNRKHDRAKAKLTLKKEDIMYASLPVSDAVRRRFREVRTILAAHSIEIRLLEGGRVSLWHTGPFGNPEPREHQDLVSVAEKQLPLTKDDRLLSYV